MPEHKKVGAFGTPCGGTTYINAILQQLGVKVKKEKMGEEGIVCGFFTWGLRKEEPQEYVFNHKIHYLRHPLLVVKTLPKYVPLNDHKWVVTDAPELTALRYWVLTHEKLFNIPLKLRIGSQFKDDWTEVASALNLPIEVPPVEKAQYGHKVWKNYKAPSWDEWHEKDPDFAERGENIVNYYELEYS